MQVAFLLILFVGAVSFCAASYFWSTAYQDTRFRFPLTFQNEVAGRFAIDHFIWHGEIARSTRRKYLLSMALFSIAAGCTSLGYATHELPFPALVFGAMGVVGAVSTLTRWTKHRDKF